jgi:hypothetical protein
MASRTGGGVGTNQHQVKGRSVEGVARGAARAAVLDVEETAGSVFVSDAALADPDLDVPCRDCGALTKRASGLCRRCDPAARSKDAGRPAKSQTNKPGVHAGLQVDRSQAPIPADEIGQCSFQFVPGYRAGARVEGEFRGCKNAVRLPAEFCHEHGGVTGSSLGRTVAKAQAEAGRGECFPVAAAHWETSDARLEAAYGQLTALMAEDTSRFAGLVAKWRAQQSKDGVGRFSSSNQALLMSQYWMDAKDLGLEGDEVFAHISAMMAEPHKTRAQWEEVGRLPVDRGAIVVFYRPGGGGGPRPEQEPGESADDFRARLDGWAKKQRRVASGHLQFPLSATSGDDYVAAVEPLGAVKVVPGHGDPAVTRGVTRSIAERFGASVEFRSGHVPGQPYGWFEPATNRIVVYDRPDDPWGTNHTLNHEIGHMLLGHGSDQDRQKVRPDQEAAAETFAYLLSAHHGAESSERSAGYIRNWQDSHGVDMRAGGVAAMRSACEAFDRYLAELD